MLPGEELFKIGDDDESKIKNFTDLTIGYYHQIN